MTLKASEIAKFSKSVVRPQLGPDFFIHTNRDLVRSRGPFIQAVLFARKHSDWLHVIPTFFVEGADPSAPVLFQTMSLPIHGIDETGKWRFPPGRLLNEELARQIVSQLERESPLTFTGPLRDEAIDTALRTFVREVVHPAPSLSLAFFSLCRGAPTARNDLANARRLFLKLSRYGSGKPPLDYEQALLARLDDLEARLDSSDGIAICRNEVAEHARRMALPVPDWPADWPTVPLHSPQAGRPGWLNKFLGRE